MSLINLAVKIGQAARKIALASYIAHMFGHSKLLDAVGAPPNQESDFVSELSIETCQASRLCLAFHSSNTVFISLGSISEVSDVDNDRAEPRPPSSPQSIFYVACCKQDSQAITGAPCVSK